MGLIIILEVVKSPWMLSPECIAAIEVAIFVTSYSKTAEVSIQGAAKLLTRVVECAELVEE